MHPQVVDISEFMERLKAEGLVIVRADEIGMTAEFKLMDFRRRMMKRRALSFSDVLKTGLLPVKTATGLGTWVRQHLKEEDYYQETKGKKCRMIMTSAIRRLGFYE